MSAIPLDHDPNKPSPYQQPERMPDVSTPEARNRADVERLRQLIENKAEIDAEIEDIRERLRRDLGPGEYADCGVKIARQYRFSPATAHDVITRMPGGADVLKLVTEQSISSELCKQILPPAVYAMCRAESGKPKVTLL